MPYADFVTAMVALFIVLWLMNRSKQIKEAVGGYFKDPTGNSKMVGSNMVGSGEGFVVSKDNMQQLKEQLQHAIREVPNFDKLQNHIDMTVTIEGLRIELTQSAAGTFFDSGSAKMCTDGSSMVKLLGEELGKLPNHLAIEGHTDSKPYPPGAPYGNWELSADRANAARRLMMLQGMREDQVTKARGFEDQRLRKPDAPLDPSNRRISLIVQYIQKPVEAPVAASTEAGKAGAGKSGTEAATKEAASKAPEGGGEKRK